MKIRAVGSKMFLAGRERERERDRQTDMTKLIAPSKNFAKKPNCCIFFPRYALLI